MIACRICGENKKITISFQKNSLSILQCLKCGFTYLDYNPKSAEIKRFYSENYFLGKGQNFGYYNYFEEKENLILTGQKRLEKIEQFAKIGNILDIGCATGFFLEAAKIRGWVPFGAEVSSFSGKVAKEKFGNNVIIGELQGNSFPENYFEAVTLWDTIEHLSNPKKTLKNVYKVLKKSGVIGLSTGDIESLVAKMSGKNWHLYHLPEHLSFFSPKTITRLLESLGFAVLSISHPGSYYTLEYLTRRLAGSYPNQVLKISENIVTKSFLSKLSFYVNLFDIMTVYARK